MILKQFEQAWISHIARNRKEGKHKKWTEVDRGDWRGFLSLNTLIFACNYRFLAPGPDNLHEFTLFGGFSSSSVLLLSGELREAFSKTPVAQRRKHPSYSGRAAWLLGRQGSELILLELCHRLRDFCRVCLSWLVPWVTLASNALFPLTAYCGGRCLDNR